MSEEKNPSENQKEKYLLEEKFDQFLSNHHAHLANDVSFIKGRIAGMERNIGLIARTSEKALETAMNRHATWTMVIISLLSSFIVGLGVWVLTK